MKKTSIRFRLLAIMLCLATLPVFAVTSIATINTRNSVEKEMISANNARMMWVNQYLNELLQQTDAMFYTLHLNQLLINQLNNMDSTDIGIQYKAQNYIQDTLVSVFRSNSIKINKLTIYIHSKQKALSVNYANSGIVSSLDIREGPWSRMLKMPVNLYFKKSGDSIYAFHSINQFEDKNLIGGLSVRINNEVWDEVGKILKSESESSTFLINDEGEILAGSPMTGNTSEILSELGKLDEKESSLQFHRTKSNFYFAKRIGKGQLTVVKVLPISFIASSANATITAGALIAIIFIVISVLISILLSLRISYPIIHLARKMQTTQISDFEMTAVKSRDEIGQLESGYNTMMKRIKELIEEEYQKNMELKNAQLVALQAQINPHFLNNTLNLIGGIALAKNVPEIYQIARTIGDLLRYAIRSDGDMVYLMDEIKHMQNYLFIQEHRFSGRCSTKLSLDDKAFNCKLPKFIIQPIVENAFEHGLQHKEGKWNIEIRIKAIANRIGIMIKDNGSGIDEENVKRIRAELQSGISMMADRTGTSIPEKRKGIGLRNVNARLKLHFGKRYGARIFSKQGVGTLVVLVVPMSGGNDKNA